MGGAGAVDGGAAPAAALALVVTPGEVEAVRERVIRDVVHVEADHAHPGLVALAPDHHPPLVEAVDSDEVILPPEHQVAAVRGPADAQQTPEVAAGARHKLHRLEVQDPEPAVLGDQGQVGAARGEGELVDGPRADADPGHGVGPGLGLGSVHGEALAPLLVLELRRQVTAVKLGLKITRV